MIFPRGTGFPDAREWIPFWTQTIYRQSGNPAIRQSGNPAIRQSGNHFAMQSGLVKPGRECAGGRGQRNAPSNKSAI
ncbi:hypothetical protein [Burkholderia glumae]|uniref:hypothetical protein n=1 Tax=Burkholderia glumae TaxID=337 RepID=UPI001AE1FF42|nr:hypothetical protein [Burkholderia glumae]MCM2483520.1 hypothetical protein [Burkholderia glumae]MCM2511422.1 hypothetical protein [Burkholderia glumae]